MRICIVADPHWSQNSSIVRSRGTIYSARLHNLIDSVNWVEGLANMENCSSVFYIGDFFDSCQLNSEEISALQEVRWMPVSHVFLTGNHETNVGNLQYATTDVFKLCPNSTVINTPQAFMLEGASNLEVCFLPYILEKDRLTITDYFGEPHSRRVIFSHNDLKDVSYGPIISKEGFSVEDIHKNCDLFINGHIHHGMKVTDKIINVGNLTGQNFTEDAFKFEHCVAIIDTETLHIDYYANPYAFNFYKIDFTRRYSVTDLRKVLDKLRNNAVITLKVSNGFVKDAREFMDSIGKHFVHTYRLIVEPDLNTINELNEPSFEQLDHMEAFKRYVHEFIGSSDIIEDELNKVIQGV